MIESDDDSGLTRIGNRMSVVALEYPAHHSYPSASYTRQREHDHIFGTYAHNSKSIKVSQFAADTKNVATTQPVIYNIEQFAASSSELTAFPQTNI